MSNWKEEITQIIYRQELIPKYRAVFTNDVIELMEKLRLSDRDELIKMLPEEIYQNVILNKISRDKLNDANFDNGFNSCLRQVKKLIQDYYNK